MAPDFGPKATIISTYIRMHKATVPKLGELSRLRTNWQGKIRFSLFFLSSRMIILRHRKCSNIYFGTNRFTSTTNRPK